MCGIAGRSTPAPMEPGFATLLRERFAACQRTRGPDGWGAHLDEDVLLVHRRLAILDLSEAGNQPLWNENGTICVVANGEIYNFMELRAELIGRGHTFRSRSDSEVLVHLYEEGGIESCCRRIEGMFAFALWDARTRDLFLVRDRLGIKPLVIAEHPRGVTFGSTTDALLADPDVPRGIRTEALAAVLEWGFVPAPWSALEAARRVLPGTWLRVRGGRVVEERRWWTDIPGDPGDELHVREALRDAVRSHLVADVPVGALMSAGIDSGLVTALALREAGPDALRVWTASHHGFPEDEFEEASRIAAHLGVEIEEIPIGGEGLTEERFERMVAALDEPLVDTSLIALHELFRPIAGDRRVVLTGDGGDEVFGGYDWHAGMPQVPAWARTPLFRLAAPGLGVLRGIPGRAGTLASVATHVRRAPPSIYLDKLRIAQPNELRAAGIEAPVHAPIHGAAAAAWDRFAGRDELEQMLAIDRATLLPDQMLAKLDVASMAHSIETRVPLLGERVVAAAKALPRGAKHDGRLGKLVLRRWFAELAPPEAAARRKTGFNSPLGAWLAGPAGSWLRERASSGMALVGGDGAVPSTPRLVFAAAMLDAWISRVSQTTTRSMVA